MRPLRHHSEAIFDVETHLQDSMIIGANIHLDFMTIYARFDVQTTVKT
jgi:hypothetical protein